MTTADVRAACPTCGFVHRPVDTGLHRVPDRTSVRGYINPDGSHIGDYVELPIANPPSRARWLDRAGADLTQNPERNSK